MDHQPCKMQGRASIGAMSVEKNREIGQYMKDVGSGEFIFLKDGDICKLYECLTTMLYT